MDRRYCCCFNAPTLFHHYRIAALQGPASIPSRFTILRKLRSSRRHHRHYLCTYVRHRAQLSARSRHRHLFLLCFDSVLRNEINLTLIFNIWFSEHYYFVIVNLLTIKWSFTVYKFWCSFGTKHYSGILKFCVKILFKYWSPHYCGK